ncbi:hypothetical protein [Candidatus Tokpelaia sp.]|uniref:hypothetical protein n=1 Tax=Candidatus Tokpelaia sp. TaxID=2233777 RepID=UPI0012394633|nr:hypothetical protein [Candidatus Tokpelaia sp.]KAA6405047.1 hypothetical protein DPQ22_05635 [Candidatus Tokpelaia sp.]
MTQKTVFKIVIAAVAFASFWLSAFFVAGTGSDGLRSFFGFLSLFFLLGSFVQICNIFCGWGDR